MNCPQCGAALISGAQFCGACGARVVASSSLPPSAYGAASNAGGIQIDDDAQGRGRGYTYEVLHQPAFSLAVLRLEAEQSIQT